MSRVQIVLAVLGGALMLLYALLALAEAAYFGYL